jgi:hypothetical protein
VGRARSGAAIAQGLGGRLGVARERAQGLADAGERRAHLLGPPALAVEVDEEAVRYGEAQGLAEGVRQRPSAQAPRRVHGFGLAAAEGAEQGAQRRPAGGRAPEEHESRGLARDEAVRHALHEHALVGGEPVEEGRVDMAVDGSHEDRLRPVDDGGLGGERDLGQGFRRAARHEIEAAQPAAMGLEQALPERLPAGLVPQVGAHHEAEGPAARGRGRLAGAVLQGGAEQPGEAPVVVAALGEGDRLGERRRQAVGADQRPFLGVAPLAGRVSRRGLREAVADGAAQAGCEDGGRRRPAHRATPAAWRSINVEPSTRWSRPLQGTLAFQVMSRIRAEPSMVTLTSRSRSSERSRPMRVRDSMMSCGRRKA